MSNFDKLIFIDLETTGANAATDRITEIGLVEVTAGGTEHWSSLVNPGMPIPEFIQGLTGIDDTMVRDAPSFSSLQDALLARLHGTLLIAHNARFDHGFLRNAFAESGLELECDVLCTVKLSRKLFPDEAKHNLDSIVQRHQLKADLIWQFWRKLEAQIAPDVMESAIQAQIRHYRAPLGN